ncbi:FeoB-associated Cys-rich membrane protein [Oceanobacillus halophilus]|uniref:FeoB-associated Cys-rich membrane protein n=1 Tax=Oceanobacillus halophilus TaxID=930130 RepID=A0A494ZVF9_9BACI|nr:FeoB-associated Cys-rich membrane protein [Oceanobacillus halophilus]RKQ30272.1 FeoB-associated Cys-rich membrane protein [Oceanobacillus halophilus]
MLIDILLGGIIIGYALFVIVKHIKRSRKGKCAACELRAQCEGTRGQVHCPRESGQ